MTLTKDRIDHYIRRFDAKAEAADRIYRVKHDHRYFCQRAEAEEIASALRIARNQIDDQHELTSLRRALGGISDQASQLMQFGIGSTDTILKELVEVGQIFGLRE